MQLQSIPAGNLLIVLTFFCLKTDKNQQINPIILEFSPQKSPNFATNGRILPQKPHFGHIFYTALHDAVLLQRFYNRKQF
jgi:hypothetical protein